MNQIQLIGRAGADAKFGTTNSGKQWANVNIATSETWKDNSGVKQEKTTWHGVKGWSWTAKCIADIRKGDLVYVMGKIEKEEYEKDGVKKTSTHVMAQKVHKILLPPKDGVAPATAGEQMPQFNEEDIPF